MSQVRNSWVTSGGEDEPFLDAAEWESIKRRGEGAVHAWIDRQLEGTDVTIVLIGEETAQRPFVRHEIRESHRRGSGLLGIHIHKLKDPRGERSYKGLNPFSHMTAAVEEPSWIPFVTDTKRKPMSALYRTYDWVADDGYENIGDWIEEAARNADR